MEMNPRLEINVSTIENLDQRYLYPLLEQFGLMSPPGIEPQTPCTIGRYSRKEPSRQLILWPFGALFMRTNPHIIWGISYPLHGFPQYMCDAQNNADT